MLLHIATTHPRDFNYLIVDWFDAIQRRLDKNEGIPFEETIKLAESHSTSEECKDFGHVGKNCPEDIKLLNYMKKKG